MLIWFGDTPLPRNMNSYNNKHRESLTYKDTMTRACVNSNDAQTVALTQIDPDKNILNSHKARNLFRGGFLTGDASRSVHHPLGFCFRRSRKLFPTKTFRPRIFTFDGYVVQNMNGGGRHPFNRQWPFKCLTLHVDEKHTLKSFPFGIRVLQIRHRRHLAQYALTEHQRVDDLTGESSSMGDFPNERPHPGVLRPQQMNGSHFHQNSDTERRVGWWRIVIVDEGRRVKRLSGS